uniref:Putative ovule protein n=1 Tax=Solanum chacoense TaxID=4108 RepID=A0A0V0IKD3_SOLCH
MYTIEFQKRGLPHAHFLIILMGRYKLLTLQSYDKIVCAELPDPYIDHQLYKLVTKHMIHGPCGYLNPSNCFMQREDKCKFKYPKQLTEQTTKGKNSYPLYKRDLKNDHTNQS